MCGWQSMMRSGRSSPETASLGATAAATTPAPAILRKLRRVQSLRLRMTTFRLGHFIRGTPHTVTAPGNHVSHGRQAVSLTMPPVQSKRPDSRPSICRRARKYAYWLARCSISRRAHRCQAKSLTYNSLLRQPPLQNGDAVVVDVQDAGFRQIVFESSAPGDEGPARLHLFKKFARDLTMEDRPAGDCDVHGAGVRKQFPAECIQWRRFLQLRIIGNRWRRRPQGEPAGFIDRQFHLQFGLVVSFHPFGRRAGNHFAVADQLDALEIDSSRTPGDDFDLAWSI